MKNARLGGVLAAIIVMALGAYRLTVANDLSAYLCFGAGVVFLVLILVARRPRR